MKKRTLCSVGGMLISTATMDNTMEVPQKIKKNRTAV